MLNLAHSSMNSEYASFFPITLFLLSRFLVEHGFDFQSQYSRGAPYLRGNDRDEEDLKGVRKIFATLVASKKPMVLHNGLIDLVFLYHNFWCAQSNFLT